jgi:hypothetical protein
MKIIVPVEYDIIMNVFTIKITEELMDEIIFIAKEKLGYEIELQKGN